MHRYVVRCVVAQVIALCLPACASRHVDMSATIQLRGCVHDQMDGSPIPGVEVSFVDVSLDDASIQRGEFIRETTHTAHDGCFQYGFLLWWGRTSSQYGKLDQGEFRIDLSKAGYQSVGVIFDLDDVTYNRRLGAFVVDLGRVTFSVPNEGALEGLTAR